MLGSTDIIGSPESSESKGYHDPTHYELAAVNVSGMEGGNPTTEPDSGVMRRCELLYPSDEYPDWLAHRPLVRFPHFSSRPEFDLI